MRRANHYEQLISQILIFAYPQPNHISGWCPSFSATFPTSLTNEVGFGDPNTAFISYDWSKNGINHGLGGCFVKRLATQSSRNNSGEELDLNERLYGARFFKNNRHKNINTSNHNTNNTQQQQHPISPNKRKTKNISNNSNTYEYNCDCSYDYS